MTIITKRHLIGFMQGIFLSMLYFASQAPVQWPATNSSIFLPLCMVTVFIPVLIVHGADNMRFKTLLLWAFSATAIIFSLSYYAVFRQIDPNQSHNTVLTLSYLISVTTMALFIAQSLILSSSADKRLIANYSTYFDTAWKLGVQIAFTAAFTNFFWLSLFLGMGLFEIIHLTFFKTLITNPWFAITATTLAITIALHITDVNVQMVRGIRTLILALLSRLLPLMTGIIGLFLMSLTYTGLAPLWQTGHASILLLIAAAILILLLNATYHDGNNTQPIIQRYAATLACCLLMPIIALAIYAVHLRVQQYGWSILRINAIACMIIAASYAFGYTLAVFIPTKQLRIIKICNITTACLIIAVYLALFTPIADPARLSVANQLSRLQTGKVSPDKFDFKALRADGLRFGERALKELQTNYRGPQVEYVHAEAQAALAVKINELVEIQKSSKNQSLDEKAKTCSEINCIRQHIDNINVRILTLLAERTAYVRRAGIIKGPKQHANDAVRVRDELAKIKQQSIRQNIPVEISLDTFAAMIQASIRYQQQYKDEYFAD